MISPKERVRGRRIPPRRLQTVPRIALHSAVRGGQNTQRDHCGHKKINLTAYVEGTISLTQHDRDMNDKEDEIHNVKLP